MFSRLGNPYSTCRNSESLLHGSHRSLKETIRTWQLTLQWDSHAIIWPSIWQQQCDSAHCTSSNIAFSYLKNFKLYTTTLHLKQT